MDNIEQTNKNKERENMSDNAEKKSRRQSALVMIALFIAGAATISYIVAGFLILLHLK